MKVSMKALLLVAMCGLVGMTACKKGKDTENAADHATHPAGFSLGNHEPARDRTAQAGSIGTLSAIAPPVSTGRSAHEGDNQGTRASLSRTPGIAPGSAPRRHGGRRHRLPGPAPTARGREIMLIVARFVQLGPGDTCP